MKMAAFTCLLFLLIGSAAKSQFTLLPQIGFEQSRTTVEHNDADFKPLAAQGNLQASLRADYRFKKGHGPFVSLSSSPASVKINFTDPETLKNNYGASKGSLQWRFEGGYQYSTKPIFFKKSIAKNTSLKTNTEKTGMKKSCGPSSYRSHCGEKNKPSLAKKDNRLNMRLQPSLGVAYRPGEDDEVSKVGNGYKYNAGNWNTALLSRLGFEFAKGTRKLFTVSIFHAKGLDEGEQTINTFSNGKNTVTYLESEASSWGMNVGIPFSLTKKKQAVAKSSSQQKTNKTNCIIIKKCSKVY
ncbi:MAG TPA: hypothetical protein VNA26_06735 [Chitinophagaceae bacterium]|nr:hypothetical protein [Chitinophagaceae bacterium]